MKKTLLAVAALVTVSAPADAQQARDPRSMGGGNCADNVYNCADTPNPLPTANTVWIEEMTWMDVRDALTAGKTTVLITTGGVEPNGPWLATGKHNYVLRRQSSRQFVREGRRFRPAHIHIQQHMLTSRQ